MKLSTSLIIILSLFQLIFEAVSVPVPVAQQPDFADYEIEDRRRKNKRKRRPCTRDSQGDARWFFGHDLTFFLGDVTICGGNGYPSTNHGGSVIDSNSGGLYEGVVPVLQRPTHRPHRPHKPHRPNRPNKPNRPESSVKPIQEEVEEDYVQDNYYRPGTVGSLSNQVEGQEQNLSNFSPTGIISTISRHFNRIVNPFIDLFYR